MLSVTQNAQKAISRFIQSAESEVAALKISVSDGGCSGFQYGLKLVESIESNDSIVEFDGFQVAVDKDSVSLLKGVTVDFEDSKEGSGFKFENPNAVKSCGCGKSFSA